VCYFFNFFFVSVNCYASWLVCVAICVSRSHSLYLKKCFPLLFTFFATESSENWPEGRKGRKGKYEKGGTHTFLFSPNLMLGLQQYVTCFYSENIPYCNKNVR
jgi:hypothetical protein